MMTTIGGTIPTDTTDEEVALTLKSTLNVESLDLNEDDCKQALLIDMTLSWGEGTLCGNYIITTQHSASLLIII